MTETLVTPERLVFTTRPVRELVITSILTVLFSVLAGLMFRNGNDAGVIFVIFALSGPVYAFFFLETRKIAFERVTASVTVTRRGARGTFAQNLPLAGVVEAAVRGPGPNPEARRIDPSTTPQPKVPTRVVLVYEDGREVPLSDGYAKGPGAIEQARAINDWLALD